MSAELLNQPPPLSYPDDLAHAQERLHEFGVTLVIPQRYLFGCQPMREYSRSKRRLVDAALHARGIDFLKEKPIVVCPLSAVKQIQLVVLDGHHRTRRAPLYGIRDIPSFLIPLSIAAEIYNMEPTSFEGMLTLHVAETLQSFSRKMPDFKQHHILPVSDLKEVKAMFPHF